MKNMDHKWDWQRKENKRKGNKSNQIELMYLKM